MFTVHYGSTVHIHIQGNRRDGGGGHMLHCKAGEANTSLKTASCEAGPGTTLTYGSEIYIWSLLIQEFDDECCFPNSICDLPKCHLYKGYTKLLNIPY
jgi:hypothetical protein